MIKRFADSLPSGPRRALQMTIDAVITGVAWTAAYQLRFDGAVPPYYVEQMRNLLLIVIVLKTLISFALGTYRQRWRYTSLREATVIFSATLLSASFFALLRATELLLIPYAIILIDWALSLLLIAGVRVLRRLQVNHGKTRGTSSIIRTLVVGAGDTGAALISDIIERSAQGLEVLGILDDDPRKMNTRISGISVLGPTTQIEILIRKLSVQHVIIAMPSADKGVLRAIARRSRAAGASVRVLPAIEDLIQTQQASKGRLTVTVGDLLESSEVKKTLLATLDSSQRDKTVLVTGGAGYIGSHLVEILLSSGLRVRVLDNHLYGTKGLHPFLGHPNLEVIAGDIGNIRDVVAAVKGCHCVFALAAIVGDPACGLDAEETLNLNYEATKVLVEACNFYEVERLVFASSCSVYGAADSVLTESSRLNPQSLYARTRIMSEEVLFENCGDVTPVILRLSTVFGLSRRMRFDLAVNALTAQAVTRKEISVFGGDQWRPFVHCRDAAEAFLLVGTAPASRVGRQIFNVGGNHLNFTIDQVADLVASIVPDTRIRRLGSSPDPRNYRVSFDRISGLGFAPKLDLASGIREITQALESDKELRNFQDPRFSNLEVLRDKLEIEETPASITK